MSSTSELSSVAARVREVIRASERRAWTLLNSGTGIRETDFEALALKLFALQFDHNAPYRRFCAARGVSPGTVNHWTAIPAVPTSAFKEFDLTCLPVAERTTVFHSSGTTGHKPSRHFHDANSLALYEASLLRWFAAHFQLAGRTRQPGEAVPARESAPAVGDWQLVILTPPPSKAPHSSLVHMFEALRRECGSGESLFVGTVAEEGAWSLDLDLAVGALQKASAGGEPLVMLGTAFSFVHLLDYLADLSLRFELPPGSCALETGGYKGRSRRLLKTELHSLISQRLGIGPRHIVGEYGMSELSSQAYDLQGIFRFPPWARVQIISPETGCEIAEGQAGLLRVFDLANVYSVMAIQTEDLGIRRADGFALAGRAVSTEPRGCSLMAV